MARFSVFALLAVPWLLLAGLVSGDAVSDLEKKGRPNIDAMLAKSKTCTKANLRVRREWGDISAAEKKSYIAALLCLMEKPSKLNPTQFPGAKTRYEDFVVVHMQQTMSIHNTGSFLSWHRYYLWAFEQALIKECNYNGSHPYWDWGRWAQDPEKSPIFDGSDTSLSGNGKKTNHKSSGIAPAGNGGGCVETGPFKNMIVRLGPVSPAVDPAPPRNPRSDGYGLNERCLRRDISNYLTSRYTRTQDIANLITQSRDVLTFQNVMQGAGGGGFGGGGGAIGVHAAGHFTIAGDPGGDFYTSPNDPAFWVHHGMIDRTWTIWQSQDTNTRIQTIAGGTSMMSFGGGGKQQSLDDNVDLGIVGDKVYKIRDLNSIVDGPFCYVYE
ncbi:hypothetical protein QBC40DRAFT_328034 [Triangularia verruculosa]|uniref:Tyrosinase copper-binding domain-containing protein n=1 Tax=Triangularia verruculosa TaxID=2587418 RepID=A0AAN6XFU3_9PEZI|nr:hypothetical protein QBC40DRAFT_328034 [Triangularia verruculosa]